MSGNKGELQDHHIKTIETVEEFGCQIYSVFSDENGPSFSYSIGFWESLSTPEVIILGLSANTGQNMINRIYEQIKSGKALYPGAIWPDLLSGYECVSRPVHPSQIGHYLLRSLWYKNYRTGNKNIEAYQIFWPSEFTRLLPWQSGCEIDVIQAQTRLDLPDVQGIA